MKISPLQSVFHALIKVRVYLSFLGVLIVIAGLVLTQVFMNESLDIRQRAQTLYSTPSPIPLTLKPTIRLPSPFITNTPLGLGERCVSNSQCASQYCALGFDRVRTCQQQPYCPLRCQNGCTSSLSSSGAPNELACRAYCSAERCPNGCLFQTQNGGVCRTLVRSCPSSCLNGCTMLDENNDGAYDCRAYCGCTNGCMSTSPTGGVCRSTCSLFDQNYQTKVLQLQETSYDSSGSCVQCISAGLLAEVSAQNCLQQTACLQDGTLKLYSTQTCCSGTSHTDANTHLEYCGQSAIACSALCLNGCDQNGQCLAYCSLQNQDLEVCYFGCEPDPYGGTCRDRGCWKSYNNQTGRYCRQESGTLCEDPLGIYSTEEACQQAASAACDPGYVLVSDPSLNDCVSISPLHNGCVQCLTRGCIEPQLVGGIVGCQNRNVEADACQYSTVEQCEQSVLCSPGYSLASHFNSSTCSNRGLTTDSAGCVRCADCPIGQIPSQLFNAYACIQSTYQNGCFTCTVPRTEAVVNSSLFCQSTQFLSGLSQWQMLCVTQVPISPFLLP